MHVWRIAQHGLVFTEFEDPTGERWVEVLREADNEPVGYEPNEFSLDLDDVAERWIRNQLGVLPTGQQQCGSCRVTVWTHDDRRGAQGDEAVEVDATIELGSGTIRFVREVLCRDCAEELLNDVPRLAAIFDGEL